MVLEGSVEVPGQAYGKTLSYELCQSILDEQFYKTDIRIMGDGLTLVYDTSPNPAKSRTPYTVVLTETAGWTPWRNGAHPVADAADPGRHKRPLDRGEFRTAEDTGKLDNVVLAPEPATMILIAAGLPLLLNRKRLRLTAWSSQERKSG